MKILCLIIVNAILALINIGLSVFVVLKILSKINCIKLKERIISGTIRNIEDYPFVAAFAEIVSENINQFCGSNIVSQNWVLTAGHCIRIAEGKEISNLYIISNSNRWRNGERHEVDKYAYEFAENHEQRSNTEYLDIGIIRVTEPFTRQYEKSVPVAQSGYIYRPSTIVKVLGWGLTNSDLELDIEELRGAELLLWPHDECRNILKAITSAEFPIPDLSDMEFCAGPINMSLNQDACFKDSGGPVIDGDLLIGVVSWGPNKPRSKYKCGKGYPGVYTALWKYNNWLREKEKYYNEEIVSFMMSPNWVNPIFPN